MVKDELQHPPPASLAEILSARAIASPRSRLIIDIAGGIAVAVVAVWARAFGWFTLAALGVCLAAYGSWAIAERRLEGSAPLSLREEFMLETVQRVAAPLGIAAFLGVLFGLFGLAFGSVTS